MVYRRGQKAGRNHQVYEEGKATFVKTLSLSNIWFSFCLNIGFLFLVRTLLPSPIYGKRLVKLNVPELYQTERASKADASPRNWWSQRYCPICPSLAFVSSSAEDHPLLLHPGDVLLPGKWGTLTSLSLLPSRELLISGWEKSSSYLIKISLLFIL